MREPKLATGKRNDNLTCVQVTREDEVEHAVLQLPRHSGEVAEEDSEIGGAVREPTRACLSAEVGPRIHPDELDAPSAQHDIRRAVGEQRDTLRQRKLGLVQPLGEGIAARSEVVVPEHDEAGSERRKVSLESAHPGPPREKIACDADDVRPALGDPLDGLFHCPRSAGRDAEMQV